MKRCIKCGCASLKGYDLCEVCVGEEDTPEWMEAYNKMTLKKEVK